MRGRTTFKVISLAAQATLLSHFLPATAHGNTYTWNSTTDQSWTNNANWSLTTTPGGSDAAVFDPAFVPLSQTVNIGTDISLGALLDNLAASKALTVNGSGSGSITLTLNGLTASLPQVGGTFTSPNVVLSATSTLSNATKNLTLNSNVNVSLAHAQNVIVATQGASSGGSGQGNVITIGGSISDGAGVHSAITFYGNGNFQNEGGALSLTGTNSFSGGLTVGSADGLNGGQVRVTSNANLGTGSILINDEGQLTFNAIGTYGNAGQLLTLNGTGLLNNTGNSGAIRTGAGSIVWAGDMAIGSSLPADGTNGYVVLSSTGSNVLELSGKLTGSGNLQKQGGGIFLLSGANNDATGATQIGNGAMTVAAGSSMSTGDLIILQSSTNVGVALNLYNTLQNVGNLSSDFTAQSGTNSQFINLGTLSGSVGGVLNIKQTVNKSFGYGKAVGLTTTIQGPGGISLDAASTAMLTLTGPNTYQGGTTINGGTLNLANGATGSATGTATITINSGGKLSTGQATVLNTAITSGQVSGTVVVNTGGDIYPGGGNLAGSLTVGGLIAHTGGNLDFDLVGGTNASFDQINDSGTLTLDTLNSVKIFGSKLAFGSYKLLNLTGSLTGSGGSVTPAVNPGGRGRSYLLTLDSTGLTLNVTDTASERYWSTNGSSAVVDGSATWSGGGTTFYNTNPSTPNAAYDNTSNNDVFIGNAGAGGTITLGSNVRVGGSLVLGTTSNVGGYTIGVSGGVNTLQLAGGIAGSSNATINAPVILEGSQTFTADAGHTVTINGNISQAGAAATLTKDDVGTVILNGTGTYTGGTVINAGILQATTTALPATGGVSNGASLIFAQANSGTYSGNITGIGSVTIANTSGSAAISLMGNNNYTGVTRIQSGALALSSPAGVGTGTVQMAGGTLRVNADVTLPSSNKPVNLTAGTTSIVDTAGNIANGDPTGYTLTLNNLLNGGGNLTKINAGTLVISGIHTTDIIGQLAITAGAITFATPSTVSYGFSASNAGNTFVGNLIVANPIELRLQGGTFGGGGAIRVKPSTVQITSRGATTINNNIILNEDQAPIAGVAPLFSFNLGANITNTLAMNGVISGYANVNFTGGAGDVTLGGSNTYTGATTIDNSLGGGVHLGLDNTLPVATGVHVTSTGILDMNGHNQTVAEVDATSPTAEIINAIETPNMPSVLTINGTTNTHFDGFVIDGDVSSLGLVLASANTGSLELRGILNTYSGGTTINGGTLSVSADTNLGAPAGSIVFGGGNLAVTGAVNTARPLTINAAGGTIDVATGTPLTVSGSGTTNWNGGVLSTTDAGTLAIARSGAVISVTPGSTLNVGSLSSVTVDGTQDPFTDSAISTKHVAIINNGSFSVTAGSIAVTSHTGTGVLSVSGGATMHIAPGHSSNSASVLNVDLGSGSTLDLADNVLAVNYADPLASPADSIRTSLISGRAGGAWNGVGIDSITAAGVAADGSNLHKTALGYGEASATNATSPFFGQTIDASTVLIRYTYLGDANLDGKVNALDFNALATNYGSVSGKVWTQGDFNYDGLVNSDDFTKLAANFGQNIASGSAPIGGVALGSLVPEPVTMMPLALAALGIVRRRRKGL